MKRIAILSLFCVACAFCLMAQEVVSGTVIDGKNEPVPGVRVEIDGRAEYATTDIDGRFRIELPVAAKKVRIIYPGFKPIEKKIVPEMIIKLGNGWEGHSNGYRGFFDFYGGVGFGGEVNVDAGMLKIDDIRPGFSFGFTTTHGYQINHNLYAGLGLGVMYNSLHGKIMGPWGYDIQYDDMVSIPMFVDVRWDFGLVEKTAPYIGLKIGCKYNIVEDDEYGSLESYYYDNDINYSLKVFNENTMHFFLQPSVGLRTRLGSKVGMNIGLSYNIMETRKLKGSYSVYRYSWSSLPQINEVTEFNLGKTTGGVMMLNIGFDF